MASKKKAVKPVKKASSSKKAAPPKKAATKPVAKKAPKKAASPKAKPAKAAAKPAKKTAKQVPASAKKAAKAPVSKKPVAKAPEPVVKKAPASQDKKIKLIAPPPVPVRKKPEPAKPVKVVIPEIKSKTVRKYEPTFVKSVLDQPDSIQTGPTMRYSDIDLQEFRELIQRKLEQAKKELAYLQGLITRKDEMGGDETENRYMTMEDGSVSMEREQLAQMASRQITYIDHLEKALMRIENKTYGICRVTGKLIEKARLRAVPHATLSIEAKQLMNK